MSGADTENPVNSVETRDKRDKLAWLVLPPEFMGASSEALAAWYGHLAEVKLAGETRVGRHPSDRNDPSEVERDPSVREVLDAGLRAIVREMAAVHYELTNRPGGLAHLLPDGPWKSEQEPDPNQ